MDATRSDEEAQQQRAKLAAEMEELIWENYWYQIEVNWHQSQANQNNHINNWSGHHEDNNSQFFGPVPAPDLIPIGWPWFDIHAPMVVNQQKPAQQQPAQQQAQQQAPQQQAPQQQGGQGQQGFWQQSVARPQAARQPIVHHQQHQQQQQQRAQQPSSAQQPRQAKLECPIQDCPWQDLKSPVRLDHLYDHLAEKHGYEKAAKEYTVDLKHIKRKTIPTLQALFIRDTRKLAWSKARILASEEAIRETAGPSYVSRHGLGLRMDAYSIPDANACVESKKKEPLKAMLIAVRDEMAQRGRLCNQMGAAESSWGQVYDDLLSTFHLARNAVDRRAEQYLRQLRVAMGDDMAQNVTAAQVELTHQLQLKADASLPPRSKGGRRGGLGGHVDQHVDCPNLRKLPPSADGLAPCCFLDSHLSYAAGVQLGYETRSIRSHHRS